MHKPNPDCQWERWRSQVASLLQGFLSISSDSSQDALGHQGRASVSVRPSVFSENPPEVDQPLHSERLIPNGSRTDRASFQERTAYLLRKGYSRVEQQSGLLGEKMPFYFWMQKYLV